MYLSNIDISALKKILKKKYYAIINENKIYDENATIEKQNKYKNTKNVYRSKIFAIITRFKAYYVFPFTTNLSCLGIFN